MLWLTDAIESIRDFMGLGGPVLKLIAMTIFIMWVLITERILFFRTTMKGCRRRRSGTTGNRAPSGAPGTPTRFAK